MPESQNPIDVAMLWLVENGAEFGVRLFTVVLILLIGKLVIGRLVGTIEKGLNKTQKYPVLLKRFIANVVGKSLWAVLWVVILSQLGVAVGPLIASLGVAGFIIGFACQDTRGNLAAGLMILANNPFEKGHFVEISGISGAVDEVTLMATTLNTPDNKRVIVPNGKVWGSPITNYTVNPTRRVDMKIGISYGADIGKAIQILQDILANDERVLKDPAPTIEVLEMADSSVNLVVRPWSKTADYWGVYWATQRAIKDRFDEGGVEIPFPQIVVHQPKGVESGAA
jgi:small conductance mechanosensitive channel